MILPYCIEFFLPKACKTGNDAKTPAKAIAFTKVGKIFERDGKHDLVSSPEYAIITPIPRICWLSARTKTLIIASLLLLNYTFDYCIFCLEISPC